MPSAIALLLCGCGFRRSSADPTTARLGRFASIGSRLGASAESRRQPVDVERRRRLGRNHFLTRLACPTTARCGLVIGSHVGHGRRGLGDRRRDRDLTTIVTLLRPVIVHALFAEPVIAASLSPRPFVTLLTVVARRALLALRAIVTLRTLLALWTVVTLRTLLALWTVVTLRTLLALWTVVTLRALIAVTVAARCGFRLT